MNNNFIALTNNDVIIYNDVQTKVYKNFIMFHKNYGTKYDKLIKNNSLNQNEVYKLSQDYCKDFKYNICLCDRSSYKKSLTTENYNEIYKCINNKRILYNINNFNFINPINLINNNEKIYPIDIFTFYRQEYIQYIINEEFIKYKNKKLKIKIANNFRLSSLFMKFYKSVNIINNTIENTNNINNTINNTIEIIETIENTININEINNTIENTNEINNINNNNNTINDINNINKINNTIENTNNINENKKIINYYYPIILSLIR
jgi:hypothetical protein